MVIKKYLLPATRFLVCAVPGVFLFSAVGPFILMASAFVKKDKALITLGIALGAEIVGAFLSLYGTNRLNKPLYLLPLVAVPISIMVFSQLLYSPVGIILFVPIAIAMPIVINNEVKKHYGKQNGRPT